jgi:hypothetical protein
VVLHLPAARREPGRTLPRSSRLTLLSIRIQFHSQLAFCSLDSSTRALRARRSGAGDQPGGDGAGSMSCMQPRPSGEAGDALVRSFDAPPPARDPGQRWR